MITMIPLIVTGGVTKKFADSMLGGSRKTSRNVRKVKNSRRRVSASRSRSYPSSGYSPF